VFLTRFVFISASHVNRVDAVVAFREEEDEAVGAEALAEEGAGVSELLH